MRVAAEAAHFEMEVTRIEGTAERWRRLRWVAIAEQRSASLRAAAARSAEARTEGSNMVSRDLVPMAEGCAGGAEKS